MAADHAKSPIVRGVTTSAGGIYRHEMPNSSAHDDEIDQKRPEQHGQQGRTGSAEKASVAPSTGGPKSGVAPAVGGAKPAIAPRVNILSPAPHATYPEEPLQTTFEIFGEPNTTVVLYTTVYKNGKIYEDKQDHISLGAEGAVIFTTHTQVHDNQTYGMHARVQSAAGAFSPLRVVEYQGQKVIETKGGGV